MSEDDDGDAMGGSLLPDRPFVSLSEALTWLAFGKASGREQLIIRLWKDWEAAAMASPLDGEDTEEWEARISAAKAVAASQGAELDQALIDAMEGLGRKALEGKVALHGQEFCGVLDNRPNVRTEPIPAQRFHDFLRFDPREDSLHRGRGLTWVRVQKGVELATPQDQSHFREVSVNRADLEREFPLSIKAVTFTAGAEKQCEIWLIEAFAEDCENVKSKSDFKAAAQQRFQNLSGRGFTRTWDKVAATYNRSRPGRKSKR